MELKARPTVAAAPRTPAAGQVLQRRCACGAAPGLVEECDACRDRRMGSGRWRILARSHLAPAAQPESLLQVLRAPGRPLDDATRTEMESRLGHDFGHVRIHTDAVAVRSARQLGARAYTVARHIAFGAGQYAPATVHGRRLLAHELIHAAQQRDAPADPAALRWGSDGDRFEGEADAAAGRSEAAEPGRAGPAPLSRTALPLLSRWKIDGDTATVNDASDRLGMLATTLKAKADNWQCIRPLSMRSAEGTPPADFESRYEGYLQLGDRFDVSNLKSEFKGASLKLSLFEKSDNAFIVLSVLYPGTQASTKPDEDLAKAAGEGKTPIADLVIGGHQVGGRMFGGGGGFEPGSFPADEPARSYSRAKEGRFPRRCWFTGYGTARSVGCNSDEFGKAFAAAYLRSNAGIDTTTRAIAPSCTAKYRRPDPAGGPDHCESIDAVEFRPAAGEAKTPDHGPFELSKPGDFHGSTFWTRLAGNL
jgi:hypothetical protein